MFASGHESCGQLVHFDDPEWYNILTSEFVVIFGLATETFRGQHVLVSFLCYSWIILN